MYHIYNCYNIWLVKLIEIATGEYQKLAKVHVLANINPKNQTNLKSQKNLKSQRNRKSQKDPKNLTGQNIPKNPINQIIQIGQDVSTAGVNHIDQGDTDQKDTDMLTTKLNDIMSLKVITYPMFILNNWIRLNNDWKLLLVLCIKNLTYCVYKKLVGSVFNISNFSYQ